MKDKSQSQKLEKFSNSSDLLDQYVTERIAMVFSRLFAKMHVKPNAISIFSAILGVAAAVLFAFHNIWINVGGAFLLIFSYIMDCCDGQVARLTKQGSINGRFIDGVCDSVVYVSIYIGLAVRMCFDNIWFTDVSWFPWIIIIVGIVGLLCHQPQCALVDYTRNFHMFIATNKTKHEFGSSEEYKKERDELKAKGDKSMSYRRLKSMYPYTKRQEKMCPNVCKLGKIIRDNNLEVCPEAIEDLNKAVKPWLLQITTMYTFNIRTYPLILCVLLNQPLIFIIYTVLVLEPLKWIFRGKYERYAKRTIEKYCKEYDN